jgi:hypothetical protein
MGRKPGTIWHDAGFYFGREILEQLEKSYKPIRGERSEFMTVFKPQ